MNRFSAGQSIQSITANGKSVEPTGSHKDTAAIKTGGAKQANRGEIGDQRGL